MSTNKDWNKWGSENPYYGVISNPKFLGKKLNHDDLKTFYDSGSSDVKWIINGARKLGANRFKVSIDFGCGAGRLAIAMSEHSDRVIGIDVSKSIIKEAKTNTPKSLKPKITYALLDPVKDKIPSKYDLVYSYIVLQHIPVNRGKLIIQELLDGLEPNGFAALHITHKYNAGAHKKTIIWLRNHLIILHYILNIVRGKKWNTPRMRMYLYNFDDVMDIFKKYGLNNVLIEPTDHGGYIGSMITGKKSAKSFL